MGEERGSLEEKVKEIELELKNAKQTDRQYEEKIARLENAENEKIVRLETRIEVQKRELKEKEGMLDGLRIELKQKEGDTDRLKEEKTFIERKFKATIGDVLSELNSSEIIRSYLSRLAHAPAARSREYLRVSLSRGISSSTMVA